MKLPNQKYPDTQWKILCSHETIPTYMTTSFLYIWQTRHTIRCSDRCTCIFLCL